MKNSPELLRMLRDIESGLEISLERIKALSIAERMKAMNALSKYARESREDKE